MTHQQAANYKFEADDYSAVSSTKRSAQQVRVFVEFDSLPWAFSRDASHKCSFRCGGFAD